MPKMHKFVNDYFHAGALKYRAGSHYEPNEETRVAVAAGHAEEVSVDPELALHPFTHERIRAPKDEKPKKDEGKK